MDAEQSPVGLHRDLFIGFQHLQDRRVVENVGVREGAERLPVQVAIVGMTVTGLRPPAAERGQIITNETVAIQAV